MSIDVLFPLNQAMDKLLSVHDEIDQPQTSEKHKILSQKFAELKKQFQKECNILNPNTIAVSDSKELEKVRAIVKKMEKIVDIL